MAETDEELTVEQKQALESAERRLRFAHRAEIAQQAVAVIRKYAELKDERTYLWKRVRFENDPARKEKFQARIDALGKEMDAIDAKSEQVQKTYATNSKKKEGES